MYDAFREDRDHYPREQRRVRRTRTEKSALLRRLYWVAENRASGWLPGVEHLTVEEAERAAASADFSAESGRCPRSGYGPRVELPPPIESLPECGPNEISYPRNREPLPGTYRKDLCDDMRAPREDAFRHVSARDGNPDE